jgi:DNA repair photolyase
LNITEARSAWQVQKIAYNTAMKPISNPPNPFDSRHRELLEPASNVKLQLFQDDTRSILSRNDSPDLCFRWSVNPYRGCFHACAYCYARPSHEYLGFGAGTDFESKLVVKPDAPSLLRQAFLKPSWTGELVLFSGNTDCYQPLEASWGLTRGCLQVCAEFCNPVGIITKAALIVRDIDVLRRINEVATLRVYISIPFASDEMARRVEPQAPSITRRLATLKTLADAGIFTGVSLAPVIPGLNDDHMGRILHSARAAGAQEALYSVVRLSGSVEPVFLERLAQMYPDRINRIVHRLKEVRRGALSRSEFFERQHGQGNYAAMLEKLFRSAKKKAGFIDLPETPVRATFRRPGPQQATLF